jgi:multiple sugar transport system ATP-binding protein
MDEPMSNLDAKLRGELRATIGHLHQSRRMTMIYVTHDQVEAMSLGDRVAVMRHGRIVQIGTPHDVYHRPADASVAAFVGVPTMNLLAGRLVPRTNGIVLEVGGASLPLGRGCWRSLRVTGERDVVIGVRPHGVRFADRGIVADVEHIEIIGDRRLVTTTVLASPVTVTEHGVRVGTGPARVTVDTAAADQHGEQRWRASHLAVDVDDIHLFDPATGRSLATPRDPTEADPKGADPKGADPTVADPTDPGRRFAGQLTRATT